MPKIRRAEIVCLLLSALVSAAGAAAVERPKVVVRCEIMAPSLKALYGPATAMISARLCQDLKTRLQEHRTLSFWEYGADPGNRAVLVFQVVDGPLGDTLVQMDLLLGNESVRPEGPWERRWRSAADAALGNDPTVAAAPAVLGQAFAPLLQNAGLEERMREKVPIAAGGLLLRTDAGPPRIVSPLPWQQFQRLKRSKFRVSCSWPSHPENAYLESLAISGPAPFDPEGADPAYDAVAMVPSQRKYQDQVKSVQDVLDEVLQLKPKWIFLQQYNPDVEVFE